MKKGILVVLALALFASSQAQNCNRDSSILGLTDVFVLPLPFNPTTHPTIDTKPACINEPYTQPITLKIQETITFNGFPVAIDSIVAAKTGAITGLPDGLTYKCDPPSCNFPKNSLGCALIYGTPTVNNTPGDKELDFKVKAFSPLIPTGIELSLSALSAGSKYYITVKPTGQCTDPSAAQDLQGKIAGVKNAPSPFGGLTQIMVESLVNDNFTFEVFDVLGQRVFEQDVKLYEGFNQFGFDAGDLADGTYFYSLRNREGKITRIMTVSR